jgi:hypothetical protein
MSHQAALFAVVLRLMAERPLHAGGSMRPDAEAFWSQPHDFRNRSDPRLPSTKEQLIVTLSAKSPEAAMGRIAASLKGTASAPESEGGGGFPQGDWGRCVVKERWLLDPRGYGIVTKLLSGESVLSFRRVKNDEPASDDELMKEKLAELVEDRRVVLASGRELPGILGLLEAETSNLRARLRRNERYRQSRSLYLCIERS